MSAKSCYWFYLRLLVLIGVGLLLRKAWGADEFPPVVHLLATDPAAAEGGGDTATFTVFRIGPTNTALTVQYAWGGTASNGADYASLSGSVTIPEGAWFAPITITPVDDLLIEGTESVIVGLVQPLVWPPPYFVFWPSVGAGFIEDNDLPPTNHPPVVRLVNPPDGSVFTAPVDIKLVAAASDLDGRVITVEFFDGTNSLGVVSNRPPIVRPVALADVSLELAAEFDADLFPDLEPAPDLNVIPSTLFRLLWENVPPGPHTLTAVATDNRGASSRSDPVHIRVLEPPPQPIVNVRATDPVATEPDPTGSRLDTATFTIGRSGPTDLPLTVYYRLGGTALNGIDYAELPHSVTIPIGATRTEVVVEPLDDKLVEGSESVVLTIVPPVCIDIYPPPPDCYLVGRYHTARAVINDNDPANHPPVVQIVRPLDGSIFLAPADIAIVAQARDFDGRVVTVEFFEGTNSLGIVTNRPGLLTSNAPEFAIKWTNVPPGRYLLTAEATDDDGASSRSRPVEVHVVDRNLPPIVSIVATDPEAAEVSSGAPNTATFQVSRTGATDRSLLVFYSVSGSASNGVDYNMLSGRIIIPAGSSSSNIVVAPIDDRLIEGLETVNVKIDPPICLAIFPAPSDCYVVGSNNFARAVIRDNDVSPSNQPPKVAIIRPQDGDIFAAPADIVIYAEAKDADGFVRSVEFFEGTNSLGVVSNSLSATTPDGTGSIEQIFRFAWNNVPPGGYVLTAKATDNHGAMTKSEPVRIKVIETHRIPVVTIEATDPWASEGDLLLTPIAFESANDGTSISAIRPFPNTATFTVKRDRGTNIPLTVYYSLDGTAENGVDYRRLDRSVTIPQGAWAARIVVDPIEDKLVEGTETVIASLNPIACPRVIPAPPECYLVGDPARAIAYIRDNDFANQPPKVEIVSPQNGQIFVAPTDIEIDVLTLDPDGYITEVEFFEGTNSLGKDTRIFIVAPPPGQVQKFSLVWSNVPPGRYELTAVATDDRGAKSVSEAIVIKVLPPCVIPVVTIQAIDNVASEQSPLILIPPDVARFRVNRSCGTNHDLRVQYAIGGTASNGVDYAKLSGDVVIPAGSLSAEIVINPIDDNLIEGTESVVLALEKPDCLSVDPLPINCYVVGTPGRDVAYIRDNDLPPNQPPRVSIVSPPDGSVFLAPVDIRIAAAAADSDGWVSFVEFFAGTNSLGIVRNPLRNIDPVRLDSANGPIAIDPILPINPFILVWSNVPPGRYELTAIATDNDGASTKSDPIQIKVVEAPQLPIVTVEATDPKASEGSLDASIDPVPNTATFTIKRRGPTNESLTVYFRLGGTASNGVDYLPLRQHVTIPAGAYSADVVIDPIDDKLVEGIETVVLALAEPPCLDLLSPLPIGDCYQLGRNHTARAVIYDNDSPPNQPPGVKIIKPENGEIFIGPVDIKISASAFDLDGRVVSVEFFEGTNSLGIVRQPSPTTDPARQLFELTWSNVGGGDYVLSAVATDDDGAFTHSEPVEIKVVERSEPPVVCIAATDPEGREVAPNTDQPTDPAVFTVSRTGATDRPLTVFYRVRGSASNAVDYQFLRGHVTIPEGASSAEIIVDVIDDLRCEGDETVVIGLVPPILVATFPPPDGIYTVCPNNRARAVIHDNDVCPDNLPPRVAIVRPEDGDLFFAPAEIAIYAEAKDPDGYVQSVEFFADNRSLCVVSNTLSNVETLFRCRWENVPAGVYVLTARATDNRGASTTSEPVRIRVIDEPIRTIVSIRATDDVASEQDPRLDQLPDLGVFTVSRVGPTNNNLTVYYRLSGSASNGVDYRRLDGTVVIPAGSREARITVDPIDDSLVEGTETVVATLVAPPCIAIYPPPPECYIVGRAYRDTVYIRDNDSGPNLPPRVAILIPSEGETFRAPADIQITAVGLDPDGWITEVFFYEGTNQIGGLAILVHEPPPPGQLQTFTIQWDGVPAGNYTLTAKAVDNRGAATLSGPIHIRVVDPCRVPVVTIAATDPLAAETGPDVPPNPANFRVRRECGLDRPLLVRYRVGGTASNGADYWTLSGWVLMQAGQSSADIPIRPIDDNLVEGTETVVLELVQPDCLNSDPVADDCYVVGREDRAIAYIRDNDFDNHPPRIAIVRPRNGDLFRAGANIPIVAQTLDPDGWVGRVEFFANGTSIGVQEIYFFVEPPPGQLQTFSMIWSNVPAGLYALTAKATDSSGDSTLSAPVRIGVVQTNPLPVVTIVTPDAIAREGTTNTATFRIRRNAAFDQDLTVYYSVRGTASNGVDYVEIPGKATIPAGRRGVRIVITPIDDRISERIETVVLRLEEANTYVVGRPARAAAIILDNDCPEPGPIRLDDGSVHLRLAGASNLCYRLEASTNLRDWDEIDCLILSNDGTAFIDPEAADLGARFFRLLPMFEVDFYDEE